jgi:hypothetical protein
MGRKDFGYQSPAEIAEEMSGVLPALHEASSHHHKKGRPSFVREDKKPILQFLSLTSAGGVAGRSLDSAGPVERVDNLDYYRSLNLREEVKGLRRLRQKAGLHDRKQEG